MRITASDVYLDTLCLLIYTTDEVSRALAEDVLRIFEEDVKENPIVDSPETRFWLGIVQDIIENHIDTSKAFELKAMVAKYKETPIAKANTELMETFEELIESRSVDGPDRISSMKENLNNYLIFYKTEKNLKKAVKLINRYPVIVNHDRQKEILDQAYGYIQAALQAHDECVKLDVDQIDFVDFTNKASVRSILSMNQTRKESNIIKFGLQGLNRMIDAQLQGVKLGEFGCLISPSHHGKTLTLMNMARWTAMYNKPVTKPGYQPAIVFISLENELDENVGTWFRDAYINLFHKKPENMTMDQMVECVTAEYGRNGFHFFLYRRIANQFGYTEYETMIKKLQASGYQVIASFIDYITLMKVDEINGGATRALQLQMLVRNMKSFANHEQIFTMTAMQIDREGSRQLSGGNTYIVKKFTAANLADCSYAYNEYDLVIFQALEDVQDNGRYLTMSMSKHRYARIDPNYKFCAWRFGSLGLMDDINGADTGITDIYDDALTAEEQEAADGVLPLKDLFPQPPADGKNEPVTDIMISSKKDPAKADPMKEYYGNAGVPVQLPDRQNVVNADNLMEAVKVAVPSVSDPMEFIA